MVLSCGDGITNLKDSFQKVDLSQKADSSFSIQKGDSFQKVVNFIHWTKMAVYLRYIFTMYRTMYAYQMMIPYWVLFVSCLISII